MSFTASKLGGGPYNGYQSKGGLIGGGANSNSGSGMTGSGERSMNRKIMRNAFGNLVMPGINYSPIVYNKGTSPFRLAFNAGDPMGTINMSASTRYGIISNQVTGINRITALGGYKSVGDGVHNDGSAAYCGNPKRVYDSSDYIKYRKLKAENRNYNDIAFGGDKSHSTFTTINHIRRF